MGKMYIGVTAVGGHKLWGVMGGKRVAESGGLEEWVNNRRIDGRRRGGCGPGMPGPYGGWWRERCVFHIRRT